MAVNLGRKVAQLPCLKKFKVAHYSNRGPRVNKSFPSLGRFVTTAQVLSSLQGCVISKLVHCLLQFPWIQICQGLKGVIFVTLWPMILTRAEFALRYFVLCWRISDILS